MFSAFGIGSKPFDLAAALASWSTSSPEQPPTPEFKGKPKRKDDATAEAWLDLVEQGCTARRVPKTHWPDVAKHFMGKKPRGRVAEVEKVMHALHGEQWTWTWTWKNFRVAVLNMGWNIDEQKTREVKVERKATGLWRIVAGNKGDSSSSTTGPAQKTESKIVAPSRKSTLADAKPNQPNPSPPSRKSTLLRKGKDSEKDKAAPVEKDTKKASDKDPKPAKPAAPSRSSSLFTLPALPGIPGLRRAPAQEEPQTMLAKVTAQVPLWLLATTEALATLANDNPDVLTAVATVLVAVGTVSGGGSAAVAAIGEAAIVVGRAIKSAHDRVHGGAQGAQGR